MFFSPFFLKIILPVSRSCFLFFLGFAPIWYEKINEYENGDPQMGINEMGGKHLLSLILPASLIVYQKRCF